MPQKFTVQTTEQRTVRCTYIVEAENQDEAKAYVTMKHTSLEPTSTRELSDKLPGVTIESVIPGDLDIEIENPDGEIISLDLAWEDDRHTNTIKINNVLYHIEAFPIEEWKKRFLPALDDDPDYAPRADANGMVFLILPVNVL